MQEHYSINNTNEVFQGSICKSLRLICKNLPKSSNIHGKDPGKNLWTLRLHRWSLKLLGRRNIQIRPIRVTSDCLATLGSGRQRNNGFTILRRNSSESRTNQVWWEIDEARMQSFLQSSQRLYSSKTNKTE